jgi:hypothetical protein
VGALLALCLKALDESMNFTPFVVTVKLRWEQLADLELPALQGIIKELCHDEKGLKLGDFLTNGVTFTVLKRRLMFFHKEGYFWAELVIREEIPELQELQDTSMTFPTRFLASTDLTSSGWQFSLETLESVTKSDVWAPLGLRYSDEGKVPLAFLPEKVWSRMEMAPSWYSRKKLRKALKLYGWEATDSRYRPGFTLTNKYVTLWYRTI